MAHRVQRWLPGWRRAEGDGPQHGRQEAQLAGLGAQSEEVEITRRPDDGVDLLQCRREHLARHDRESRPADGAVVDCVIHEHSARLAELQSGGVEIAQGAQPRFLADLGRVGEQGGDHDVEQVEHVVLCGRFQRPHKGQQRRCAPLQRHARHGLRLGHGRKPGKRRDPAWRHMVNGGQAPRQHPDLVQAADGAGQLGTAAKVWPVPKTIERTGAAALSCDQQGIKLRALFGHHIAGERAPEATGGPGANAGDQTLKSGCAGEQHLLRHQPDGRAVEQHARPVCAGPAERVKPARQAEVDGRIGELAVAVALLELRRMQPSTPGSGIFCEAAALGMPSCWAKWPATPPGTAAGSSRNAPRKRTVLSWTANPSRM
jgi:hypothetical protein